jgi:uncharacterized protein YcaQ
VKHHDVVHLTRKEARRLALARAGLLKPEWTGLPSRATGGGVRARRAAQAVIERFGYLQLDTVSIAGARSHVLVLLSRLQGFSPRAGEELLQVDAPLFEYWGHEASWIPLDLYPLFGFRRRAFRSHPWWGNLIGEHQQVARELRRRIRQEGPLRSSDMEGRGSRGWWDLKLHKRVASALWSSGELSIRERRNFQRLYDLTERVIPESVRRVRVRKPRAIERLLLKALEGHGWATRGTLVATWRLSNEKAAIDAALQRLQTDGRIVACSMVRAGGGSVLGWIRPQDLELVDRLRTLRPRDDRGVLLSPFDPLLWDRSRVHQLFDFDQVLEIFKPAPKRRYGYFCLPVLAGERLVARFDLRAHRREGRLQVLRAVQEPGFSNRKHRQAARHALQRHADALQLHVVP